MTFNSDIKNVARELGLPSDLVLKYYEAYWSYIKESIEGFNLKSDMTEEEYSKMRVNFNLPYLGKLACPYQRQKNLRKQHKKYHNGTNVSGDNSNSK